MPYQADEEEKPFLANGRSTSLELESKTQTGHVDGQNRLTHRHTKLVARGIAAFLALQIILIGIYTYVYLSFAHPSQSALETVGLQLGASVEDIDGLDVRWQRKKYTAFQDSAFTRAPSSSTDAAWERLLENMTIRVTKEELERAGQTSIELPGGGYMAWLGVHHELHCIKYIREWKYKEHFFPIGTEEEVQHRSIHADHCIEMLRSAAMCRADTSLTTFLWESQPKPMLDLKRPMHTCIDWEAFERSVSSRVVSVEEGSLVTNPNTKTTAS